MPKNEPLIEWVCHTCEDQPHFTHPECKEHLTKVHGIDVTTQKFTTRMTSHLDGAKFFETHSEWVIGDVVRLTKMIRTERTGEDAIWWKE